ncbi:MAG: c-type cytochrome [Verrucomicrobiaceae bacterium]|nr:c-type cytochrome [Verrucomicrobiaceae bacterium]
MTCHPIPAAAPPLLLLLSLFAPALTAQEPTEPTPGYPDAPAERVTEELFVVPEGLEVTLWAGSPQLFNPTNIDIDIEGRIWVAEGVRYRRNFDRQPEGDRIVVLQDTDGDGKADSSHTFVQEPLLIAPLGVAVIDNKIVVSQPPHLLVYTDVDRDLKFDPAKDKREILLTGFNGQNHDHSLHSVTVGPDGKWYFNSGNLGGRFTDKSGKTFTIFGEYRPKPIGPFEFPHNPEVLAGTPSDDGHVYVGGFTARMNPDGSEVEIIGHNYRNSYEQSITSLGDVFQNDNDDPPACRVSWVMEYANFGFSSNDGQRGWRVDKRPGQTTAVAEWRQENPGITPAGDVYGGGSPTGNVFYENGALGEEWIGTFFACEPGRNVIFSYQPELRGAGFQLDRHDFATTNPSGEFAGSDFLGGNDSVNHEVRTLFRPSDIAVGPDGALYVSDWYDARVGGHQALDGTCSGAIYRIAPKGFQSVVPKIDITTIEGQIEALKSPAVNVRAIGFEGLKARGRAALDPVAALLDDPNPYLRGRAVHLLYQLGISGPRVAGYPAAQTTPEMKIAAFRAMRRAGLDISGAAAGLAEDENPAVRREVALAMRNEPLDLSREILVSIARGYDGQDRSYLEAFGTGATGKEAEIYSAVKDAMGDDDARRWSDAFAGIAWRLHPPSAIEDLSVRAQSGILTKDQREQSLDAIAFIRTRGAATAMLTLAQIDTPLKSRALWWLMNRMNNDWKEYGLLEEMKTRGIYDPGKVVIQEVLIPEPDEIQKAALTVESVLALTGDPERGKTTATRCIMCHEIGGTGVAFGPPLDGWGRGQTLEVIVRSIVDPSADISHGFDGTELVTKDGKTIHGLLLQDGNPAIISGMGGITQILPKGSIASKKKLSRSMMLSAAQLGLTAQDVADLAAFLKGN